MGTKFELRCLLLVVAILGVSLFVTDSINPLTPDPVIALRLIDHAKAFFAHIQFLPVALTAFVLTPIPIAARYATPPLEGISPGVEGSLTDLICIRIL